MAETSNYDHSVCECGLSTKVCQNPLHHPKRIEPTVATNCSVCGAAIEWRKDFDRPYPANADGKLHRCSTLDAARFEAYEAAKR